MTQQTPRQQRPTTQDEHTLRLRISLWLPLIVAAAMAAGMWIGFELHARTRTTYVVQPDGTTTRVVQGGKIDEVLRFVEAKYIESVDLAKLEDAAAKALLKELDPHSGYISLSEINSVNESLSGGFEGIGVEFSIIEDTVYIIGVIADGPSDKAGIRTGDKIISIGDSTAIGINSKSMMDKLKGASGSSVTVGILRADGKTTEQVAITRGQIPIRSVDVAYMLDAKTGFIKINRFSEKTYKEFMEALERLIDGEKMENLVIDLRDNPGGYLSAATDILNQLFDSKKLLVYTEGRSYKRKDYYATGKTFYRLGKIAVLIDEGSASASEILAGAIQDNDRGVVVGRRSFGKGLVQEQYPLTDGSAMRLTVARYYTPSGRLIQKPYKKGDGDEYDDDLKHRVESGELYHQDSVKIADTTKYYTQAGRVVYGGGGIMPDIFVPLDTVLRHRYLQQIYPLLPSFIYKRMNTLRAELLAQYPKYTDFEKGYSLPESLVEEFIAYTERKNVVRDEAALRLLGVRLRSSMRAYIAQQLYQNGAYFRVMNQTDEMVQKALKAIASK